MFLRSCISLNYRQFFIITHVPYCASIYIYRTFESLLVFFSVNGKYEKRTKEKRLVLFFTSNIMVLYMKFFRICTILLLVSSSFILFSHLREKHQLINSWIPPPYICTDKFAFQKKKNPQLLLKKSFQLQLYIINIATDKWKIKCSFRGMICTF